MESPADASALDRETKVEFGAVPLTLGILGAIFLVYAAAVGGLLWWLLAGVVIAGAIAGTAAGLGRRAAAADVDEAPRAGGVRADDRAHRVLVIADRACGSELPTLIRTRSQGTPEARVLAPVLGSRLSTWTGDEGAYREATAHLEATLAALRAAGIAAEGRLGAADPLRAADDGLGEYSADEIVFALGGAGDGEAAAEHDLILRAEQRYEIPVSALAASPDGRAT